MAGTRPTCVAAENYSVGIDDRGRLVIWGRPGWMEDELPATPPLEPQLVAPARRPAVAGDVRIASVAASRHALFAVTGEGSLMYAKVHSNEGVIRALELRPLSELVGVRIASISTRYGQAFAITEDGEVYAWGMKSGDTEKPEHSCSMGFGRLATLLQPTRLPCFGLGTPIRSIATGISHTMFVTVHGEVYAVGRTENGKLGTGSPLGCQRQLSSPVKISFGAHSSAPHIVAAAAGARHSLFLASSGEVWGCGMNKIDALPTSTCGDDKDNIWEPVRMDKLDIFCTTLAAGISCSFFVSDAGAAYFTGTSRQSKRPFGREANPRDPFQIPGLHRIEQVTVSMEARSYQWEHAIFAQQGGRLFGWGHLGHGELVPASPVLREDGVEGSLAKPQAAALGCCPSAVPIAWRPDSRKALGRRP